LSKRIPTYPLQILSDGEKAALQDILLLDHRIEPKEALDIPHRTGYYGIGLCIRGEARLVANLETYTISPGCLIAMSPHIVKQWQSKSPDFETTAVLFTNNFFNPEDDSVKAKFQFFQSIAKNIFPLSQPQAGQIRASLAFIHQKYAVDYTHRNDIIKELIQALLFEVASLYEQFDRSITSVQTRGQALVKAFKNLVTLHYAKERAVTFYAGQLFITSRHLTETVREVTGRTPGEWIAEAVILESKVLLLDLNVTIAQIADQLSFPDASTFGKYFKNITGMSPGQYRTSY
jgi:AraC-like DNA-binding protein